MTADTEQENESGQSIESLYMQVFPWYLSIGCTYNEFWYGEPWVAASYREAELYRMESRNYDLWLQGLYDFRAVSSALAMAFWNKKGKKPDGYFEYPIPVTDREKEADKQRRIEKTLEFFRKGQMQ